MGHQPAATPAVERFEILGEDGYSEFWRRDKSPIEPVELSKLLLAIRKITAYIGRNVGDIVWSGMDIEHAIALDPSPIMGSYPVPAAKTDLMVGLAIQQAFKRTEWSERVRELATAKLAPPPQYQYKFNMFLNLAEDVYTDNLANRSVLGHYAEAARRWRIKNNARRLLSPPTLSELLHLWWAFAADRDENAYWDCRIDPWLEELIDHAALEKYYRRPLKILAAKIPALRHDCPRIPGIAERTDFRVELYLSTWNELLPYVRFWIGDSGDRFMVHDISENDEELAVEDAYRKAVKATISSYAKLIERSLPKKNRDLTDLVMDNVMNTEGVVPVAGNDVLMPARDKIDKELRHRLERVVRTVAARSVSFNRGLTSGKIHSRRLYRAHTTGAVFQEKKHEFDLRSEIMLLIDATGSMADPAKWGKAEVIYQTLFTAIHTYAKNARLFAYNEVKDTCRISELYRGRRMFTLLPNGKTASGEAIIATALGTRSYNRRRLIIHLTDGASNWGCGVGEAIALCRKRKIGLLTLGIDCSVAAKQSLREEYGKLVQFVDKTEQLPHLLGTLLGNELRHSSGGA
ncbi:hypothetical protein [Herminiimonas sp. CN]|uniref:vWA domain-containing protein n=1 Tax=Herminiimonas sp. CN TaxID=1349818 RepID=UPI0004738F21|nr:hypothetical protein [Herminiimonas sp. CN]